MVEVLVMWCDVLSNVMRVAATISLIALNVFSLFNVCFVMVGQNAFWAITYAISLALLFVLPIWLHWLKGDGV